MYLRGKPHPLQYWVDGAVLAVFENYCKTDASFGIDWKFIIAAIDQHTKESREYSQWAKITLYDRIELVHNSLTKWAVEKVLTSWREKGIRLYRLRTEEERKLSVPK